LKSAFVAFIVLAVLWFALSGHTSVLMLSLGSASCITVVALSLRMGVLGCAKTRTSIKPIECLLYCVWLLGEIVKANMDVSKRILTPGQSYDPVILKVPADQQSEVGRVIHANSITLTPGTLAIEVSETEIEVHALSSAAADDLAAGEIGRRVTLIERNYHV
jgi:multicomponent Na+:H+ antiporter subunit E